MLLVSINEQLLIYSVNYTMFIIFKYVGYLLSFSQVSWDMYISTPFISHSKYVVPIRF